MRRARLFDLVESPNARGRISLTKVVSLLGSLIVMVGFVIQSKNRDLDWSDWLGMAISLTILSGGPLANRIIAIWGSVKMNGLPQGGS
jgi:hypothetical protein